MGLSIEDGKARETYLSYPGVCVGISSHPRAFRGYFMDRIGLPKENVLTLQVS